MSQFLTRIAALKPDKKGVTALEYGLIAALIAVVIIATVTRSVPILKLPSKPFLPRSAQRSKNCN